jgi:glycosyltransferase involved in cell wall biosynthesis
LGQTHPKVVARYGQEYRQRLESQAQQLGVESMVDLDGHYLGSGELARAIAQASVVLLPYRSRAQVTSGVLAEAVAAGKPVVATAFPHAVEMLSDGAGTVVPHDDATAIAVALRQILTHQDVRDTMSRIAKNSAVMATWPAVGAKYRHLAQSLQIGQVAS